eukprot:7814897-Pyramimonas_sp.AAC.1
MDTIQRQSVEKRTLEHKSDCQDEAVVLEKFAKQPRTCFVGVFDGHGVEGRSVAKYVATKLPQHLSQQSNIASADIAKVYPAVFAAVEKTQKKLLKEVDCGYSGATACFAVTSTDRILLGNVGNSKAVMVQVCT